MFIRRTHCYGVTVSCQIWRANICVVSNLNLLTQAYDYINLSCPCYIVTHIITVLWCLARDGEPVCVVSNLHRFVKYVLYQLSTIWHKRIVTLIYHVPVTSFIPHIVMVLQCLGRDVGRRANMWCINSQQFDKHVLWQNVIWDFWCICPSCINVCM